MGATARTVPGADVTFAAFYPGPGQDFDYKHVPKEANIDGTVTWTWVIPLTTHTGRATLGVVAGKGADSASASLPFSIAKAC